MEYISLEQAGHEGGVNFYVTCAQLNITNGGNGAPGPLVEIPGVYNGKASLSR
jgi:hypothetical protein